MIFISILKFCYILYEIKFFLSIIAKNLYDFLIHVLIYIFFVRKYQIEKIFSCFNYFNR